MCACVFVWVCACVCVCYGLTLHSAIFSHITTVSSCDRDLISVLTFIVLSHWSIMPQTLDMIPHPVTLSWRWVDQSWLYPVSLSAKRVASYITLTKPQPPVSRSGHSTDWANEAGNWEDNGFLFVFSLLQFPAENHKNDDQLVVPIIENTTHENELTISNQTCIQSEGTVLLVSLFYSLTAHLTTMVMSRRSGNLTTFSWASVKPYLMHTLSPVTDNCPA